MRLLDPEVSDKIATLQQLDDAIAFRFGRLERPCLDCMGRHRCIEHAYDQRLLEGYKARYAAAWAEAFAGMDPDDIDKLMQAHDMPPTAAMLAAAIAAGLREAAAHGPVVIELDGQPVVIELDGNALVEHLPARHASPPRPRPDHHPARPGNLHHPRSKRYLRPVRSPRPAPRREPQ
jgi:hypothetical protein